MKKKLFAGYLATNSPRKRLLNQLNYIKMTMKSILVVVALFAYIVSASDVLDLTESNFDTEGKLRYEC